MNWAFFSGSRRQHAVLMNWPVYFCSSFFPTKRATEAQREADVSDGLARHAIEKKLLKVVPPQSPYILYTNPLHKQT